MKKEQTMVICAKSTPEIISMTLGQEVDCSDCGTKVYLSDSSLNSVKQNSGKGSDELGIKVVCLDCGIKHINNPNKVVNFIKPTNEQLNELKDILT